MSQQVHEENKAGGRTGASQEGRLLLRGAREGSLRREDLGCNQVKVLRKVTPAQGSGWKGKGPEAGMCVSLPSNAPLSQAQEKLGAEESRDGSRSSERAEVGDVKCGAGAPPAGPGASECPQAHHWSCV